MNSHPTPTELSDFLLGKLPSDSCDTVAIHLEDCGSCQETVRGLERAAGVDPLVDQLRRPTNPQTVDAECQAALAKAAAIPPTATGDGTSDISRKKSSTVAVSKDQFLAVFKASEILGADDWASLSKIPELSTAADGATAARVLVEKNVLTKFQAQHLLQGKTRGFKFGDYIVTDHLGAGGMGQVFKARHRRMDRVVALKVLSPTAMKNSEAVKRFQREVKAAAKLIHPNIVTAFDAGEQEGVFYLVMEFVDGSDLSVTVKKKGPLSVRDSIDVLLQAARGLAFAHSSGVVHRDIKPANLLIDKNGTVRILDMGLARFDDPLGSGHEDGLTQSGQVMGTIDYMAPEQAFNTREATAASDVYSLGCTLHRLLTGQPMYEGQSVVEKILAHREKPVPTLRSSRGNIPPRLVSLFEIMVAKRPEDRPLMPDVVRELENLAAGMSGAPIASGGPSSSGINLKPTEQFSGIGLSDDLAAKSIKATNPMSAKRFDKASQPASAQAAAPSAGAVRGRKPPSKILLAASGAGAIVLVFGIWVVIKNGEGQVVGVNEVPAGGSATVVASVTPPTGAATATSPKPAVAAIAPAEPFTDRSAAEWIISRKGKAYLLVDGEERTASEKTALPTGPFKLVGFGLSAYFDIPLSLEELRRLAPLKLAKLHLARAKLSDAHLAIITENPELREIDLFDNIGITNSGVALLTKCSKLERVGLQRTKVSDSSIPVLAKIKNLINLNLGDLPVTDAALAPLSQLPNLEKLRVHGCSKLTGEFALHLRENKLKEIDLGFTQLTRKGLEAVASLPQLQLLALYTEQNPMPAEWLSVFAGHPSLAELNLDGNIVGDAAVTYLQSIPKLAKLHVDNTGLTTAGITELRRAKPNLQIIGKPAAAAATTTTVAASRPDDYALEFDGRQSFVDVPSLALDSLNNVTIELTAACQGAPRTGAVAVLVSRTGDAAYVTIDPYTGHELKAFYYLQGTERGVPVTRLQVEKRIQLAFVVRDGVPELYLNGKRQTSSAGSGPNNYKTTVPFLSIGRGTPDHLRGRFHHGLIDEIRISKVARYASDFVPPTRLEADQDTLALYHFDEGTGDVLKDSSGNNHHGKIVGAKWVRADGSAIGPIPPSPSAVSATTAKPRLRMDGDDRVEVPTLRLPHQGPLTLEGYFTPDLKGATNTVHGLGSSYHGVYGHEGWKFMWSDKDRHILIGKLGTPMEDRRTHVAGVLVNGELRLFVDGKLADRQSDAKNFSVAEVAPFEIGGRSWHGVIEEVRVSSVARYDQDFVPAKRFEPDAQTLALYHFDEGTGDVLTDSSGNGHHGKIVGGKWVRAEGSPLDLKSPVVNSGSATPPPAVAPFDAAQAKAHQEAWAKYLGTTVETTNSVGTKLVLIPPGEFRMGDTPGVAVTITKPFRLGKYELTQEQWQAVMGTTPWNGMPEVCMGAEYPAHVNYDEALLFCRRLTDLERNAGKLSGDLEYMPPTEAQWEYACRAGTRTEFFFGDDVLQLDDYAWYDANTVKIGEKYAHLVGTKRPNNWGLHDIYGNVYEWCLDVSGDSLPGGIDPLVTGVSPVRVQRGSSWFNPARHYISSGRRSSNALTVRGKSSGVRIALVSSGGVVSATPAAAEPPPSIPPVAVATATKPQSIAVKSTASTTDGGASARAPASAAKTLATDPNDPTAKKLATAKTAYDKEMDSIKKTVLDALDRREALARRQSDKAAVDLVKAERDAYEKSGDLPKAQWSTLDPRINAAKKTLVTAYETAIRDYTRAGKDAQADAISNELAEFQKTAGVIAKIAAGSTKRLTQKELLDLNREIAAWALGLGGKVVAFAANGQSAEIKLGQIPNVPFAVKELHMNDKAVTDADLDKIAALPSITHLELRGTQVTEDGVVKLGTLTNLQSLNLHARPLTDRGVAVISGLKNLEHLDIAWAKITEAGLDAVADLPKLRIINLFAATVTDEGLRKLTRLRNLRTLEVKNPKISPDTYNYLEIAIPGLKIAR